MNDNRRDFLKKSALLGLTGIASGLFGKEKLDQLEHASALMSGGGQTFTLPKLPYAYEALEPFIDKQTMEIHYSKHHQGYVNNLNAALASVNMDFNITDAQKCAQIDVGTLPAIRNNLGGHFNHSLFWTLLKPNPKAAPNLPVGNLAKGITRSFSSFEAFKETFAEKAARVFGSGWCWLVVDEGRRLKILTTSNQDNPLMSLGERGNPVLALDVWEHAYYLKHQNKRADYITNWWNVVNWEKAEELFNTP